MTLFEILIFTSGFLLFAILLSVAYGMMAERKSSQKLKELNQRGFKVVNDLKKQTKESEAPAPVHEHTKIEDEIREIKEMKSFKKHETTEDAPQPKPRRKHKNIFEPANNAPESQKQMKRNYRDLWR